MLPSGLRTSGNITQLRGIIFRCWPRHQSIFVYVQAVCSWPVTAHKLDNTECSEGSIYSENESALLLEAADIVF